MPDATRLELFIMLSLATERTMQESSKSRHFQKFGPMIDGVALLDKHASEFVASLSASAPESRINSALSKIAKALNTRDFADAAIRFAHVEKLIKSDGVVAFSKANFDPSQPRNAIGEWSETGNGTERAGEDPKGNPGVGYCKIVKELA